MSQAPPRLDSGIWFRVGTGLVIVLVAPFARDLVAYLDGRYLSPFLLSVWIFPLLGVAGIGTVVTILSSRTLFSPAKQWARYVLGFGLLISGPAWYFIMGHAPVVSMARGAADAARARINVPALQSWAVQVLRDTPAPALDPTGNVPSVDLPWASVPVDVRAFLGPDGTARVEQSAKDERFIRLHGSPLMLYVGGPKFRTKEVYPATAVELAPGVFSLLRCGCTQGVAQG
jgi:hypothetical protein